MKAVSICRRLAAGALLLALACSPKPASEPEGQGAGVSVERLSSGMEVVLLQNRSTPMICSSVVVKAGVMYETPELNGASHMLEHLLFNGTKNRTQEQLYDEVDFYGGYNNATTRADHTLFEMLMPAEHIAHGLEIQADMLFNSTLPPEKLEKERGIVMEEIGKDEDDPSYTVDNFFDRIFYGDSPMGRPALGTREMVSQMSREAIADYYHKHYTPENMVAFVIGDFDRSEMMTLLERYFGSAAVGPATGRADAGGGPPSMSDLSWEPYEIYTRRLEGGRNYVQIGWPVAGWRGDDAAALRLIEWLLNSGPVSGLDQALKGEGRNLADLAGASYTPYSNAGVFRIWAQSSPEVDTSEVLTAVIGALARIAGPGPDAQELRGAYISMATEEIYQSERIHYFSMLKAPALAAMSPEEFVKELKNPTVASEAQVMKAARGLLLEIPFVVCAAGPALEEGHTPYAYFAPPLEGEATAEPVEPPKLDASSAGIPMASSHKTVRREIPGGPVAIILQNPDSRVFAVHVLIRDRSAMEPPGKEGIADMLHRLLPAGTVDKDRETLERELSDIGAELKVTDNPYIPYDDYYFVPDYSYLRLDTIDIFYKKGLQLVAEMLTSPRFDEAEIERVRQEMLAAVGKAEGSTRATAKRLYYETLLAGTPLAASPQGTSGSIASITRDDLIAFHRKYMDPSNLIVSVACNVEAESVLSELGRTLSGSTTPRPAHDFKLPPTASQEVTQRIGKGQSYIYMGFTCQPSEEDEAPLAVMTQILSDRMSFDIREKQGLAYMIGADLSLRPQGAWLTASMGTSPENIDAAKKAMLGAFPDMAAAEISQEDVERTRNSMLGRHLMRTMFSMGRAYHAGLAELFGENRQGSGLLEAAKRVQPADVHRVASRYLSGDEFLVVIVE
jgi:zinc protease